MTTQPPTNNNPPTDPPVADPPEEGAPNDAARNALKDIIKETLAEFVEENQPDPARTKRKTSGNTFLDSILGF